MDNQLPPEINYFITSTSKNDCFFVVGPESGPIERIGAHKMFLLAASEPFRNMLEDSELAEKGDIRIIDVSPHTMKIFLKCVYGGSYLVIPKLTFQELVDLFYIVEKYLVTSLKSLVIEHLLMQVSPDNVVIAISSPACLQEPNLAEMLLKLVKENTNVIMSSKKLFRLTPEGLMYIIKQNALNINELEICDAVFRWAKHHVKIGNAENARLLISEHLKFIRFCTMDCKDFCSKVIPADILTHEEVYQVCKSFGLGNAPDTDTVCVNMTPRIKLSVTSPKSKMDFYHIVNNVKDLAYNVENSLNFNFLNNSWNIIIWKKNNYLGLFLQWNIKTGPESVSSFEVEGYLALVNQNGHPDLSLKISHVFTEEEIDWGYSKFCHWDKVVEPNSGFVKNNTIIVKVHVEH